MIGRSGRALAAGVSLAAAGLACGGCVTAYGRGQRALDGRRYDEASRHFESALVRQPDRVDALEGLGIAEYKRGNVQRAIDALEHVVVEAPGRPDTRLYLALGYLRQGDDLRSLEQLAELRTLGAHPRLAGQIDRAVQALRGPLSPPIRDFIAAGLEHERDWERDVAEARRAPRARWEPAWGFRWDDGAYR